MATVSSTSPDLPVIIIGVAGGSGSGKTTLTKRIQQELGDENVAYLLHDSYYKDITHLPIEERAKTNFDHPDSLDTELLVTHICALKRGLSVDVPQYDFTTHSRTPVTTPIAPKKIILVEGILIFSNPDLVKNIDLKVFVNTQADVRFMRRLKRDMESRGRTFDEVVRQYNETVRPMHDQYVEPSKHNADVTVNNSDGNYASMKMTVRMITNHLRVEAGLL